VESKKFIVGSKALTRNAKPCFKAQTGLKLLILIQNWLAPAAELAIMTLTAEKALLRSD
jgi:hypothetical protein